METGSEITAKIRSAIKAKLVELGAYVDEELPDYIMVMIANKKTKEQMTNDLNLFLGKNSEIFTDWVHKVLDRLQAISQKSTKSGSVASSSSAERDKKKSKKSSSSVHEKMSPSKAEKDIDKRRSSGHEKDDIREEIGDSVSKHQKKKIDSKKEKEHKHDKISKSRENDVRSRLSYKDTESYDKTKVKYEDQNRSPKQSQKSVLTKTEKCESHPEDRSGDDNMPSIMAPPDRASRLSQRIGTVRPMKRKSPSPIEIVSVRKRRSIVGQVVNRKVEEEAYEEAMRTTLTVSSAVRVTERKSKVPKTMQAKPSIFLKALCEANASVSKKRRLNDAGENEEDSVIKERKTNQKRRIITEQVVEEETQNAEEAEGENVDQENPSAPAQYVPTPIKRADTSGQSNMDTRRIEVNQPLKDEIEFEPIVSQSPTHNEPLTVQTDELINPPETRFFVTLEGVDNQFVEKINDRKKSNSIVNDDDGDEEDLEQLNYSEDEELTVNAETVKNDEHLIVWENVDQNDGDVDTDSMDGNDLETISSTTKELSSPMSVCAKATKSGLNEEDERNIKEYGHETQPTVAKELDGQDEIPLLVASEKIKERCKYWPACKMGDACPYQHPNTPCRSFPSCRFGDRCLFIHPKCRFDGFCTNKRCAYSHSISGQQTPHFSRSEPPKAAVRAAASSTGIPCKFGNRCANSVCPFKHPKPCAFGAQCLRPGCAFSHPSKRTLPAQRTPASATQKFKWVAPSKKADNNEAAEPDLIATKG